VREQCDFAHRSLNAPDRVQRWRFIIHSGVFTIRPTAIARRIAQKAPVHWQVCLRGFSSIKLRAELTRTRPRDASVRARGHAAGQPHRPDRGDGVRTGMRPHTGCPARGPGRGRYSLSGAALNLGPTRSDRHATAHHPLGRGGGILAAAAPQAAYPLARLGWALGETEGAGWPTRGTGAPSNPVLLLCAYAETITGAIPTPEAIAGFSLIWGLATPHVRT